MDGGRIHLYLCLGGLSLLQMASHLEIILTMLFPIYWKEWHGDCQRNL